MLDRPVVRLLPGRHKRLKLGHPWAYSNEIEMTPEARRIEPGSPVTLVNAGGELLGTAIFNPHSLAAVRLLGREASLAPDRAWLGGRLKAAADLRMRLGLMPYCRLVHAEADGLPGVVVDLFGGVAVVQLNTAGMARLEGDFVDAVREVLDPAVLLFRNDSAIRGMEGLDREVRVAFGDLAGPIPLIENGRSFLCDPEGGQKTGWFYDQRENRAFVAQLAHGARVLDVYAYLGGFGLQALAAGAREVVLVDRSEAALALVQRSADGLRTERVRADAFTFLEDTGSGCFDVVIVDPPAFVKSRKDLAAGLRGYRKLVRLAARRVARGGILFAASCSHNVGLEQFAAEFGRGLGEAGRLGRILRFAGAGPDHPVHPMLPESAYLKAITAQLA